MATREQWIQANVGTPLYNQYHPDSDSYTRERRQPIPLEFMITFGFYSCGTPRTPSAQSPQSSSD